MTPNWNHHYFKLGLSGILAKLALLTELVLVSGNYDRAQAQIIPDDSLGAEASVVTPNVEIKGLPADRIDGGALRDSNLFHSFEQFNIGDLQRVYFANPEGITNIFSRVTGSNLSEIFGTLGVNGNANLFFINPNGIIFGENASLDVGGSFVASTADAIQFGERGFFSATDPEQPPLLTVQPSAFFFNQINSGKIENHSTTPVGLNVESLELSLFGLRVPDGQSLLLLGGDIELNGGGLNAQGGRIELGGITDSGLVELNFEGNDLHLNFPDNVARSNIFLTNDAVLNARGEGGSITLNARNIEILDSVLLAGIFSSESLSRNQAGDIKVQATETVNVENSLIANQVEPNASGQGGNVTITTGSLSLSNGGRLLASTFGQGDSGKVIVRATDTVQIEGVNLNARQQSAIFSRVEPGAVGNSGGIEITTGSLSITEGGVLQAGTRGIGNAGDILIHATNDIFGNSLQEVTNGGIDNFVFGPEGIGNAGDIQITTNSLLFADGAAISSSTSSKGDAGNITINAAETIQFDGVFQFGDREFNGGIFSIVTNRREPSTGEVISIGEGTGGDITLTTGQLIMTNGSQLAAGSRAVGDAGNVTIRASELIQLDGTSVNFPTGIFTIVEPTAVGEGGNIDIEVTNGSLLITNGARLSSATGTDGNAGNIIIRTADKVIVDGVNSNEFVSSIRTGVEVGAAGQGGDIDIETNSLSVTNGAELSASTAGDGMAGDINVAANLLEVINGGQLLTTTESSEDAGNINLKIQDSIILTGADSGVFANTSDGSAGNGGSIIIDPKTIIIQDEAQIAVDSQGSGEGGEISLMADSLTLDNQASISAETASNTGGDITLKIQDLLLLRDRSTISTTAGIAQEAGDGGNITVTTPLLVAFPQENSDITANAFTGNGGNINIDSQNILGFQLQEDPNRSNITASSRFGLDGTVNINTSGIQPTQELIELPIEIVDVSKLINQNLCLAGQEGEFIITGKGGLSPSPKDTLNIDAGWEDWRVVENSESNYQQSSQPRSLPEVKNSGSNQIVEAQGWYIAPNGNIVLTAEPVKSVSRNSSFLPLNCHLLDELKQ